MEKTAKKTKFSPQTTAVVVALSVLIIAESIWLVGKLDKISGNKTGIAPTSGSEVIPTKPAKATVSLLGSPSEVKAGGKLSVSVLLEAKEGILSDGMDLVITYDPEVLKVIDEDTSQSGVQIRVDDKTLFKTVGRNFVEPENKRILVTLLNLDSDEGVRIAPGGSVSLATINFQALVTGETTIVIQGDESDDSRKTQIVETGTGEAVPLDKKDLPVVILE